MAALMPDPNAGDFHAYSFYRGRGDDRQDAGEVDRLRNIWGAVLLEQFRLATRERRVWARTLDSKRETMAARDWFGGRDFRMVCEFAGVDSDYVLAGYRAKLIEIGEATK